MSKRIYLGIAAAITFGALATVPLQSAYAAVYSGDDNPSITQEVKDDAFLAGENVSVTAPVLGELFSAGSTVTISQKPARSVFAAGNTVSLDNGAGYNAFVAGNTVTLSGDFGHDVYAAGSNIVIKEGTVIHGNLIVAGEKVTLAGTVAGDVHLNAGQVTSSATVGGMFKAEAPQLTFTGGSIAKDLTYTTETVTDLDKVVVSGKTTANELKTKDNGSRADNRPFNLFPLLALGVTFSIIANFLLGALLLWLMPEFVTTVNENVQTNWKSNTAHGILTLVILPVIAIAAFITLVGWPIGLLAILLFSLLTLLGGSLAAIIGGHWVLDRLNIKANRWASLIVGVLLIALLKTLPALGPWFASVVFIAFTLPAIGALVGWAQQSIGKR